MGRGGGRGSQGEDRALRFCATAPGKSNGHPLTTSSTASNENGAIINGSLGPKEEKRPLEDRDNFGISARRGGETRGARGPETLRQRAYTPGKGASNHLTRSLQSNYSRGTPEEDSTFTFRFFFVAMYYYKSSGKHFAKSPTHPPRSPTHIPLHWAGVMP